MNKEYTSIEDLDFFKELEQLIDDIWEEVMKWVPFARDTLGKQLVESADSSASNLVEGDGRYSYQEAIRFFQIARGSAREAQFWIRRARKRKLMTEQKADSLLERFSGIVPKINSLIRKRREWSHNQIREETVEYFVNEEVGN